MQFKIDDMEEIAAKFTTQSPGVERHLILLSGLPGVGKTTVAKELARQTRGLHFDIDEIKRLVVPQDLVTEDIDPPEYRFEYYSRTIHRLPSLFAKSPTQVVIIDETFHMRSFRQMWNETCKELNVRVHWIEAVCCDKLVKERLRIGKDRENHILSADEAYSIYRLFKKAFEPMEGPYQVVDTGREIVPQVEKIVTNISCRRC